MLLDPGFLIVQTLNGLQLAALLFLLSIGLSVVFGLMNFINLAHGTLFMAGAYLALSAVRAFDSFWLALLLAPLGVAVLGALLYLVLLRHLERADPMRQVLATFGLIFVGVELVDLVWGSLPHTIAVPPLLAGSSTILGQVYPTYRLFIIALGVVLFVLLYAALERTRLGAVVRAGVDNRTMVAALGINIGSVFFLVFCLGCLLAGLAGAVAAPVFSIFPGMDMSVLILALIVVVLGGPGSLKGVAAVGALIIGVVDTYGQVVVPGPGADDRVRTDGRDPAVQAGRPGSRAQRKLTAAGPCTSRDRMQLPAAALLAAAAARGVVARGLLHHGTAGGDRHPGHLHHEPADPGRYDRQWCRSVTPDSSPWARIRPRPRRCSWAGRRPPALVLSMAVAALLAAAVGVFVVRLSGVFFIMITLAVGQMLHAFLFRAKLFGGDNGLAGTPRFDLAPFGLDAGDSGTFAALALLAAALVYLLLLRLTRSPFGMMLAAIHQNEHRLASLGCPVRRYKLAAFAAAGRGGREWRAR